MIIYYASSVPIQKIFVIAYSVSTYAYLANHNNIYIYYIFVAPIPSNTYMYCCNSQKTITLNKKTHSLCCLYEKIFQENHKEVLYILEITKHICYIY